MRVHCRGSARCSAVPARLARRERLRIEHGDGERVVDEVLARHLLHLCGGDFLQLPQLQVDRRCERPAFSSAPICSAWQNIESRWKTWPAIACALTRSSSSSLTPFSTILPHLSRSACSTSCTVLPGDGRRRRDEQARAAGDRRRSSRRRSSRAATRAPACACSRAASLPSSTAASISSAYGSQSCSTSRSAGRCQPIST